MISVCPQHSELLFPPLVWVESFSPGRELPSWETTVTSWAPLVTDSIKIQLPCKGRLLSRIFWNACCTWVLRVLFSALWASPSAQSASAFFSFPGAAAVRTLCECRSTASFSISWGSTERQQRTGLPSSLGRWGKHFTSPHLPHLCPFCQRCLAQPAERKSPPVVQLI